VEKNNDIGRKPDDAQRLDGPGRVRRVGTGMGPTIQFRSTPERDPAIGTQTVRAIVRHLSYQRAAHQRTVRSRAVEGFARRTRRRDARGDLERHPAHAWIQALFRARRDRGDRRLSQDRARAATGSAALSGYRLKGEMPCKAHAGSSWLS